MLSEQNLHLRLATVPEEELRDFQGTDQTIIEALLDYPLRNAFVELKQAFDKLRIGENGQFTATPEELSMILPQIREKTRKLWLAVEDFYTSQDEEDRIALIVTGVTREGRDRLAKIKELVRELAKKSEKGFAREEDILREAESRGLMSSLEAKETLEFLLRNNSIYRKGGSGTYALLAEKGDVVIDENAW